MRERLYREGVMTAWSEIIDAGKIGRRGRGHQLSERKREGGLDRSGIIQ